MFKSYLTLAVVIFCVVFAFVKIGDTQTEGEDQSKQTIPNQLGCGDSEDDLDSDAEWKRECYKECVSTARECESTCEGDKDCIVDCVHEYIDCISSCSDGP